ncbi:MAG: type IX secretion system sortase PorU [Bacteroidia bacterium]
MRKYYLTSVFIFLFTASFSQSAKNSTHRIIIWKPPFESKISENESITLLNFEGAKYDPSKKSLPFYGETFDDKFDNSVVEAKTELLNDVYEPLKETSLITDPSLISSQIVVKTTIGYERKIPILAYSFIPIRKNPLTNSYEKLVSFDLKFTPLKTVNILNNIARYYAPNSVLATGTWFKIAVVQDGVYKITGDFLKHLGVDTTNLDPRNIKLFGNGGGMLPYLNAAPRADDLVENAIAVAGESDGHFNTGDYILFFGQAPDQWHLDASDNKFHHTKNLFSDTTFYFLTYDIGGVSKRIGIQTSSPGSASAVTSFDDYKFYENDFTNFIKSGRKFYGESFDANLNQSFAFNFPNILTSSPVYLKTSLMAHSYSLSSFSIKYSGNLICQVSMGAVSSSYTGDYGTEGTCLSSFNAANSNIKLDITYNQPASTSIGYLDYIELNARRSLIMDGNQMMFRDRNSVGTQNASYTLDGYNPSIQIWDISDIYNIKEQSVSSAGNFIVPASDLHEFIAFNNASGFLTPYVHGKIDNQNLHSLAQTDLIIVSNPKFISEANRLADFHRTHDNLRVVVADVNQVYNEYSSGARDVTALRDFVKMFYDRNTNDIPRYFLLFGDGSYENKKDYSGNTNFLPTYESVNSLSVTESYVSDDYFGLLDSLEGIWDPNGQPEYLDVGVGRFPVKTLYEATALVDKVIRYETPGTVTDATACNISNSSLGDWRNVICLVADDEDSSIHLTQTEDLLIHIDTEFNLDKIYLDAYHEERTPGGQRYPDVNVALNNRVEKGAFLVNYTGHGGEIGWAHEDILNNTMINGWSNKFNMPLFITATCEFSRYDDPGRTSAGENVLLNPNGGGIALYSTSRLVYSSPNAVLNQDLVKYMFQPVNGEKPRLGDIFRLTKRDNAQSVNPRNFVLLGDPAMQLAYPEYDIVATKVNGQNIIALADTISALSKITISGEIRNNGQKLTNFNGVVYPTVFDKVVYVHTLVNDPASQPETFKLQKNILYKGKASVVNGDFSFTFIVPKDIAYNFGTGRLSFYAQDGVTDASGYYDSLIIGGVSQNSQVDNAGPDIKLYLNNDRFVFGGLTDQHPKIYAVVTDSTGVNTVGNGIGHDITAVLDGKSDPVYVLNDFYEADLNSYQQGKILYRLDDLEDGRHNLKLKVWDIYNNSSEAYTEFIVASDAQIALSHVLNYPNPFTTHTTFFFEHNQPCNNLDVQVQIFTVSGKLIKTIIDHVVCQGYRSDKIEWNGRDDFNDPIGRGVYIYRLKIKTTDGKTAEKIEKLVVLK